ncbi:MAG: CoA transferase [Dehalococcoidia bacterium]|nr:CoA transferase [Dehalococcoidia bacterium]
MGTSLNGLLVLDLTRVLAGPFCTMQLADLGARVIKIEPPPGGDDARAYGPFVNGESLYFASLNRNKESLALDLKSDPGREVFLRLAQQADVVVENFRPGAMARLRLEYERLRDLNPRLVYAACTGFGQTGPYRFRPAYDVIVQAMGGVMSLTGQPGGEPTRVGVSIGDITAGLYTAVGILAALESRHRTGAGQFLDVSMMDCQVAILENAIARLQATGETPRPIGNRHPSITPFTSVSARDAELVIAAGNDALWGKLCAAIGRPDLEHDPRFVTNGLRTDHQEALARLLKEAFSSRDRAEWLTVLEASGVPCGPINSVADVVADPQVQAREMLVDVDCALAGPVKMPGSPIKLSETNARDDRPAPLLGQHSRSVLRDLLKLKDDEIDRLAAAGAIGLGRDG